MTRRPRSVSFSETVEKCQPPLLDKSSYSDYLNSWYSSKDHKGFKRSMKELVQLLETNPNLSVSPTRSTIFRGIERHTSTEKVRIREKREISYSIVSSLQGKCTFQMAKMLRSHSDECLMEAHKRALEDEKTSPDAPSTIKKTAEDFVVSSPIMSPRPKLRLISRPALIRSF